MRAAGLACRLSLVSLGNAATHHDMTRDYDQTVSFALMGKLLMELESRCDLDENFSLSDILDSFSLPSANKELLQELVVHHFRILQDKNPKLTPEEYIKRFPEHGALVGDLEELLNPSRIGAALLAVTDSGSRFPSSDHDLPKSASVPEFRAGPLELLPVAMQKTLHAAMNPKSYADGEVIVQQGEEGDLLFVCCAGAATVSVVTDQGEELKIGRIVPGQVIGEMALMGVARRTATVTAEGVVDVLTLSKEEFHRLLKKHQEFSNVITTIIGERLGNQRRDALSSASLEGYLISGRLGRGGMAVVYDAVSEQTNERVALKMMSHRLSIDEQARDWFDKEAEMVASFDHPNIPRLIQRFDAFATAFMAIEFVEGEPLSRILKSHGPFDEEAVLCLMANLADALDYAHEAGIVHRDVKPSNCMVDTQGNVKLMDFGLSVPFFTGKDSRRIVAGTPAYMSPEQFRGEIRPESDWFALGCVAYELLVGKRLLKPKNLLQLANQFDKWNVDEIVEKVPEGQKNMRDILRSLLSMNLKDRSEYLADLHAYRGPVSVDDWACFE